MKEGVIHFACILHLAQFRTGSKKEMVLAALQHNTKKQDEV
jgi:hypothetical protein